MNFTTVEQAILITLRFFAIWQHPLSLSELRRYVLKYNLTEAELQKFCQEIPEIIEEDGLYTVQDENIPLSQRGWSSERPGISSETIVETHSNTNSFALREHRKPLLEKRLKKARRFLPILRFLPFIRAVYVCNNLSFGIATETGDIDLLIVTEKDHIFLARFWTTFLLHILGIRRHGKETSDRFCLSFFVTEDNLDFSNIALKPSDIYLAYWTYSLLPVFEVQENISLSRRACPELDSGEYPKGSVVIGETSIKRSANKKSLPEANLSWLQNYFHIERLKENSESRGNIYPKNTLQSTLEFLWKIKLGKYLEDKIVQYQKVKLAKSSAALEKKSGIIISDKMLKFHDDDRRQYFQDLISNASD